MRVLVNAASLKEGGSVVVLDQLLSAMRRLREDIDWGVAVHPSVQLPTDDQGKFVRIDVGNIDSQPFGVLRWYEFALPAAIVRFKADLVFSITNYLPLRTLAVPTVLLVQHAGHFSTQFDALYRRHLRRPDRIAAWTLKTRWVERSVRSANVVTVQTAALADSIVTRTGRPRESVHVIPHGPGTVTPAPAMQRRASGTPMRIGYIAKWGVQKNFGVLIDAAARLLHQGRDVKIVLTLAENLPENRRVVALVNAAGLGAALENAGEINAAAVSRLYDSLDIFVFPSLVESFGFPLVEAMAKGLPIVAADTPSNREIAGDAASFFSPADGAALAQILGELIDSNSLREMKSAMAFGRAQALSWPRAAQQTFGLFNAALGAKSI